MIYVAETLLITGVIVDEFWQIFISIQPVKYTDNKADIKSKYRISSSLYSNFLVFFSINLLFELLLHETTNLFSLTID